VKIFKFLCIGAFIVCSSNSSADTSPQIDNTIAKEVYEKACELKDGDGCLLFGVLYAQGHSVSQDYQQASVYYQKACEFKEGEGCLFLGFLYAKGQGVSKDYQQAKTYYEKACELGEQSGCNLYKELNEKLGE
jgi:uncharacterized protein